MSNNEIIEGQKTFSDIKLMVQKLHDNIEDKELVHEFLHVLHGQFSKLEIIIDKITGER